MKTRRCRWSGISNYSSTSTGSTITRRGSASNHSGGFDLIACPEMFIAAAAQRTRHIRPGTGVVSLPYHNLLFMLADRMVHPDPLRRAAGR